MARILATLAMAGAVAVAVAKKDTTPAPEPTVTAFFPQLVGEDLSASVVNVKDSVTTLEMCIDGSCDSLMWTFIYGESTAGIELTALDETLTIGCDITLTKDVASCSLTDYYSGTTTTETIVLDSLTDFMTTFAITAGATLLSDLPAATATSPASDDDDDGDDHSHSSSFSLALPSSTATPASTATKTSPSATGDAANVPDGEGAAAGLARPAGLVGLAVVAAAVMML